MQKIVIYDVKSLMYLIQNFSSKEGIGHCNGKSFQTSSAQCLYDTQIDLDIVMINIQS